MMMFPQGESAARLYGAALQRFVRPNIAKLIVARLLTTAACSQVKKQILTVLLSNEGWVNDGKNDTQVDSM